jgi:hypothetical protein
MPFSKTLKRLLVATIAADMQSGTNMSAAVNTAIQDAKGLPSFRVM